MSSFSDESITEIIRDLTEDTINNAVETAEGVWANLTVEQAAEAKRALRRYSENQLNMIRFPGNSTYTQGAAHNINTLQNLASAEVIHVRREARAFSNMLFDRILDAGFKIIDAAL